MKKMDTLGDQVLKLISESSFITFRTLFEYDGFSSYEIRDKIYLLKDAVNNLLKRALIEENKYTHGLYYKMTPLGYSYLADKLNSLKVVDKNFNTTQNQIDLEQEAKSIYHNLPTTFFSYSRSDQGFVLKLAKDLRTWGYNIWVDQFDIKTGVRWAREVEKALHKSGNFLVIVSPASLESDNVDDEISVALEEKKRIIPVIVKQCKMPLRLRSLQYIDFADNYEEGLEQLKKALGER